MAELEGADPQRAAFLALFHDTQETRLTDIPYIGKRYLKAAPNAEVTADQTTGLPEGLAGLIGGAESEYEARESSEAVCARDADKLECLLQAVEYRVQGTDTQAWIDTSLAALKTLSAQRLAKLALEREPLAWMHEARDSKPRNRSTYGSAAQNWEGARSILCVPGCRTHRPGRMRVLGGRNEHRLRHAGAVEPAT